MKLIKNSMKRLSHVKQIGAVLGVAICAATTLQAQSSSPTPAPPSTQVPAASAAISHADREFLQFAAQANQTEIAMADVAEARSHNLAVKELAQMMRTDHQQNNAQLQVIVQSHLVAVDANLNAANQKALNRLQKANEADFDKDYTKCMLKDHVKAIATFDKLVSHTEQGDIRSYAQNTLPALRNHLRHSEDAARATGLDESTISSILKGLPNDESSHAISFNQN